MAGSGRVGSGWRDLAIPGYEAFSVIGRGGHGVVVMARQLSVNRTVAIKLLVKAGADERSRRRFDHERAAMGRLDDHPNIVLVVDSGFRDDGIPYLVMEYLAGGSLAAAVQRDGPLPWKRAVDIGIKLAGALETANQRTVLHRDVKPENVLFSAANEPKLGDFGIARAVGAIEGTGGVGLSISQAAPETFEARYSPRSDVYSLASSIMTVILGHPPFVRGDEEVVPLARICNDPPPNLRGFGVPRGVCEVLEQAMAKDPADRHRSAANFGEALRRAQSAAWIEPTTMLVLPPRDPPLVVADDPPTLAPRAPTMTAPQRSVPTPPVAPSMPVPSGDAAPDWANLPTSDAPSTGFSRPSAPAPRPPTPYVPPVQPVQHQPVQPVQPDVVIAGPPPAAPTPPAPGPVAMGRDAMVVPPGSVVIYRPNRRPPARRISGLRAAVVLFVCVSLVAAGTVAAAAYARSGYFVGIDGSDVAIYKGRPGGFLFFKPQAAEPTTVTAGALEADQLTDVGRGVRQPTLTKAREYVQSLRTTTTSTLPTTPTTFAPSGPGSTTASTRPAYAVTGIGPVRPGTGLVPAFTPTMQLGFGPGWSTTVAPRSDLFEISDGGDWVISFWAVSKVYSASSKPITTVDALAAVMDAPGDVALWLRNHPQLNVTNVSSGPTPPGATGMTQFTAKVFGGYQYENCSATCVLLFQLSKQSPAIPATKLASERSRFYVITTRTGTIVASASTKDDDLDRLVDVVMKPLIASLVIG